MTSVLPPKASTPEASLRRTMTFRDLMMNGLVFIGPAAAVGLFGPLDARSHGATALVYVVATLVMGSDSIKGPWPTPQHRSVA